MDMLVVFVTPLIVAGGAILIALGIGLFLQRRNRRFLEEEIRRIMRDE